MSKLLEKPFKAFTFYALIILVCSIPVYYLVVDFIWMSELDEHNENIVKRVKDQLVNPENKAKNLELQIENWQQIQPKLEISESPSIKKDSLFFKTEIDSLDPELDFERYRGLVTFLRAGDKSYRISIQTNIEEVDETLLAIAIITASFFFLLVVGFVFLNKSISKKIWKPFWQTLEKLKKFDLKSNQKFQSNKTDIKEFDELNSTLEKLIERNMLAYSQQKTFIENASHELQTPLAVLKSKIDVLMQIADLNEDQSKLIESINAPLSRVSRINKNLLVLAKIENQQFLEVEEISLEKVLLETVVMFSETTETKLHLEINNEASTSVGQTSPRGDRGSVTCNLTLLEILLNNLIVNAIRHNHKNQDVFITLSRNLLRISNAGISALETENLFKRFGSISANSAKSGLGLAIIKEVCNQYKWQIEYRFEKEKHIFQVQF